MDPTNDTVAYLRRLTSPVDGIGHTLSEALLAIAAIPVDAPVALDMALHDAGASALAAGHVDRATALLRRSIAFNPHHAGAFRLLGNLAQAIDRTRFWSRSLRLEEHAETRFKLALTLNAAGQTVEALEQYEIITAGGGDVSAAYVNRAAIFYHLNDRAAAVEDARKAIRLDASQKTAFNILVNFGDLTRPDGGTPDFRAHVLDAAREHFLQAEFEPCLYLSSRLRQFDPSDVEAIILSIACVVETGRPHHALKLHRTARHLFAGLDPDSGTARRLAATSLRLLLEIKNVEGARLQWSALPPGAQDDPSCSLCGLELRLHQERTATAAWVAEVMELADRLSADPVTLHHAARALRSAGQLAEAETLLRRILDTLPKFREARETLVAVLDDSGQHTAAAQMAKEHRRLSDPLATRYACEQLSAHVEKPKPRPRTGDRTRRIAMSRLGGLGRFGNQMLQYAFLRIVAARLGLIAETSDWVGRRLFGHDDPLASEDLPQWEEDGTVTALLDGTASRTPAGHDIFGFFQVNTRHYRPHRPFIRDLFRFVPPVRQVLQKAERAVRGREDRDVIAIHVRRGDFTSDRFWAYDERHYIPWLRAVASQFRNPVLYIASDDASMAERFREFGCVTDRELWDPLPGAEFLLDHHMLACADAVAISNSSFSFSATLLNDRARLCVRPKGPDLPLVRFDPWDDTVVR